MTPTPPRTAGLLLEDLSDCIDAQDWVGLAGLLAPDFTARYVHTGETFDRDAFVALNRDYPGAWRFERQAVVDAGRTGALRARVSDAAGASAEVHFVASFASAHDGLLSELVEVWAEAVSPESLRR